MFTYVIDVIHMESLRGKKISTYLKRLEFERYLETFWYCDSPYTLFVRVVVLGIVGWLELASFHIQLSTANSWKKLSNVIQQIQINNATRRSLTFIRGGKAHTARIRILLCFVIDQHSRACWNYRLRRHLVATQANWNRKDANNSLVVMSWVLSKFSCF